MLDIENLNIWYGGIHAVKGIDMNIEQGEIVTLIGANGAGKSSTIRAIAGLVRGYKGTISYTNPGGKTLTLNGLQPENMVGMGIALSPEGRRILPQLTVRENLLLGAYTRNDKEGIEGDIEYVYGLFPRLK
ncbi:MAG: ATP-binding cassette domain-containing protein, partial [Synergistaceae bacterium]|nr:ATP-binding cassette domain-containing protein [Synergistaceae bacterium]